MDMDTWQEIAHWTRKRLEKGKRAKRGRAKENTVGKEEKEIGKEKEKANEIMVDKEARETIGDNN